MDSIATTIGYVVLIAGAFWLVAKFLQSKEGERNEERAFHEFQHDLRWRATYRSTTDPVKRQRMKDSKGNWAILGLEDDDAAFYASRLEDPVFRKAWEAVKLEPGTDRR